VPAILTPSTVPESAVAETTSLVPELAPRNCTLSPYEKRPVRSFSISTEIIAYASPDSTFAVTKRLIDAAKKSIIIGIYDFTADHIKQLLFDAMRRGVKVELMLDLDGKSEEEVFRELELFGAKCTPAPSCASDTVRVFRSSHEKVIVIDDEWTLVQSGNYSDNSIPLNEKDGGDPAVFVTGNRDTGLAVRSKPLAKYFRKVLEEDIKLQLEGPEAAAAPTALFDTFLVEAAPTHIPKDLFPSKKFQFDAALKVLPVLSPENYMDVVPKLLQKARKSVLIEQQYIRASQEHIEVLLDSIVTARKSAPNLDVRIVLGKIFNKKDLPKEEANLELLAKEFKLKLGKNIRYINTQRFVHCHNKLILVDDEGVLVSSQNWSNAAVTENREAGLWLEHAKIAGYFRKIFESDWSTAVRDPTGKTPETMTLESLPAGQFIRVMASDYAEV
jgi:phosphatidylserine/phosphatidylglycerophosphate/cardiolipin synthase-like enzyme